MITATAKWFNNAKGYGFVTLPDGRDAFLHYSAIECSQWMRGFRTVPEGSAVLVTDTAEGPKGVHVTGLIVLPAWGYNPEPLGPCKACAGKVACLCPPAVPVAWGSRAPDTDPTPSHADTFEGSNGTLDFYGGE